MATVINIKKPSDWKRVQNVIKKGLSAPFKSTRSMFLLLGSMIDRDSQLTFKGEGQYLDRQRWKDFKTNTLINTKTGTWKIRYGTDLKGRPGMQGKFRPGIRRYSSSSKLLQASGGFKQSFRILKIGTNRMIYGTRHKLADEIMSNPTRNVLQYTGQDQKRYSRLVMNWFNRKIKF